MTVNEYVRRWQWIRLTETVSALNVDFWGNLSAAGRPRGSWSLAGLEPQLAHYMYVGFILYARFHISHRQTVEWNLQHRIGRAWSSERQFESWEGQNFVSSQQRPNCLWVHPSLLLRSTEGSFVNNKARRGVKLIAWLNLVSMLRIRETIPTFPYTSSLLGVYLMTGETSPTLFCWLLVCAHKYQPFDFHQESVIPCLAKNSLAFYGTQ